MNKSKVEVVMSIVHEREVNKARYCPQNKLLIATKSPSADVLVFDYSKHPSKPRADEANLCKPNLRLKGHAKEGYGLAWSPHEPGKLASAGDDHLLGLWDIGAAAGALSAAGAGAAAAAAAGASSSSSSSAAPLSASAAAAPPGTSLQAVKVIRGHTDVVEDVAWHRFHPQLVGSCGDDKLLQMCVPRARARVRAPMVCPPRAATGGVTCLIFSEPWPPN